MAVFSRDLGFIPQGRSVTIMSKEENTPEEEVVEEESEGWHGLAGWLILLLVIAIIIYCVAGAAVSGLTVLAGISCLLKGGS